MNLKSKHLVWEILLLLLFCGSIFSSVSTKEKEIQSRLETYLLQDEMELAQIFLDSLKHTAPSSSRLPVLEAIYLLKKGNMDNRIRAQQILSQIKLQDTEPYLYYFARGLQFQLQNRFEGAIKFFRKALEIVPTSVPVMYEIARCYFKLFLVDLNRYSSAEIPFSFRDYAIKEYQEGIDILQQALADQFNNPRVWKLLGLFYLELGDFKGIVQQMQPFWEADSTNVDLNLLLGIAHLRLEHTKLSQKYFDIALKYMNSHLAKIYRSPELLLTRIAKGIKPISPQQFWAAKDPFFLTPENERFLEHLSRIAYVDLRFGIPERNIPGWDTDRGRIYLRYGPPRQIIYFHQTIEDNGKIYPATEIWRYPDFEFMFEDVYWNQNFTLAQPEINPTDHSAFRSRAVKNYQLTAEEVLRTHHELYQFIRPAQRIYSRLHFYQFDGLKNKTLLWIPFEFDLSRLVSKKENIQLAIFWWKDNPVQRKFIKIERKLNELIRVEHGDSLWAMEAFEIPVIGDSIHYSLEGWAKIGDYKFIRRGSIRLLNFSDDHLQISDLVLAYATPFRSPPLFKQRKENLLPNILQVYRPTENMQIYFELYNLQRNKTGETHYRVESTIKPLNRSFFRSIMGSKQKSVTVENIYQGNNRDDYVYFNIQMNSFKPGKYALKIRVTDDVSGQTVTRKTTFLVLPVQKKLSRK